MRQKKWWFFGLMAFLLLAVGFTIGATSVPEYNVTLNGEKLVFDVQPAMENGRLLVPLRSIAEALGAQVHWVDFPQGVIVVRASERIELWLETEKAVKNGMEFALDAAPRTVNGRVLVPLRFISEALGAEVSWNKFTGTAAIKDAGPGQLPPGMTPAALPVVGSYENLVKLLEQAQPADYYGMPLRERNFVDNAELKVNGKS